MHISSKLSRSVSPSPTKVWWRLVGLSADVAALRRLPARSLVRLGRSRLISRHSPRRLRSVAEVASCRLVRSTEVKSCTDGICRPNALTPKPPLSLRVVCRRLCLCVCGRRLCLCAWVATGNAPIFVRSIAAKNRKGEKGNLLNLHFVSAADSSARG